MQLRKYQSDGISAVRDRMTAGSRRVVYVLPTGGGKSLVAAAVCAGVYQRKKRAVLLAHRDELLDQLSTALKQTSIPHGLLYGGTPGMPRHPVVVASIGTLANRLKHFKAPDLIFIDECHHAVSGSRIAKILDAFPNAKVMGLTATPQRLDGRGLIEMFSDIVIGPSVSELTAQGFLVPAEIYSTPNVVDVSMVRRRAGDYAIGELEKIMDRPSVTGDAVAHYERHAKGKAAVVFTVSVKHAKDVAEDFTRAGYRFVAVDGGMNRIDRKRAIEDLRVGKIHGVTSCEIIGEGVDLPRAEVVILLRPTESLTLAMQQIGRGLRPYPGKDRCIILDHASVIRRHGFPDQPRDWTLEGCGAGQASDRAPAVRTCEVCYAMFQSGACPRCGHLNAQKDRKVTELEGDLVQVSDVAQYADVSSSNDPLADLEKQFWILRSIGRNRGYTDPRTWAWNVVSARLADKLQRGTVIDSDALAARTVDRDRVMTAMGNEDEPEEAA